MKALFYDWFGLNEWLFKVLHILNFPYLGDIWKVLSVAYSYWAVAFVALAIGIHYLKIRHSATERQLEVMSECMFVHITAFSVVWCCVYTFQNVTLLPRPWMVFHDTVAMQNPILWHEGLPASAPALSLMMAGVFWKHVSARVRAALVLYVALGGLLSVVSGVNWPVEVVAGAAVGLVGVGVGRWYFRFGKKLVAP